MKNTNEIGIGPGARRVVFRFNMVEVALALVILAIGLSSVMVLFPVGLRASRNSIADNNLADIAERVAAYLQAQCVSSQTWGRNGTFSGTGIPAFNSDPGDSVPTADEFSTDDNNSSNNASGMDGLFQLTQGGTTYYLYRQYSNIRESGGGGTQPRAVDFEAMIRVGWDASSLQDQYYSAFLVQGGGGSSTAKWQQIKNYSRGASTDPSLSQSPMNNMSGSTILDYCCRALIIEISWPADAPWSRREKRIFRVEMFNENFVPYPQTTP